MALVPIIQPFAIKLVTTKKERAMHMPYNPKHVSRSLRICFPIMVTIIAGFIAPMSVSLVGFLMFGNLLRECGCLERLSETAQNDLANLITLLLGITISFSMQADQFVNLNTLIIMALGLVAFVFDSIAGVMFAKLLNLFCKNKVNPDGRRGRHLGLPDVRTRYPEDGAGGGLHQSPADARRRRERRRSDRIGARRRHDPQSRAAAFRVRRNAL